jgi:hypothetical protein
MGQLPPRLNELDNHYVDATESFHFGLPFDTPGTGIR